VSSLSIPGFSGTAEQIIRYGNTGLAIRTDQNKIFLVDWDPRAARNQVDLTGSQSAQSLNFGNRLINAPGTIRGQIFFDADGKGSKNGSEPVLAGQQVFLDQNDNGQLDANERTTVTDASGNYVFGGLAPGSYIVTQIPRGDRHLTAPAESEALVREI